MTSRGFIQFFSDHVEELSYDAIAMPSYSKGSSTVTENDGLKYLTFIGQDEVPNPLANSEYLSSESVRTGA